MDLKNFVTLSIISEKMIHAVGIEMEDQGDPHAADLESVEVTGIEGTIEEIRDLDDKMIENGLQVLKEAKKVVDADANPQSQDLTPVQSLDQEAGVEAQISLLRGERTGEITEEMTEEIGKEILIGIIEGGEMIEETIEGIIIEDLVVVIATMEDETVVIVADVTGEIETEIVKNAVIDTKMSRKIVLVGETRMLVVMTATENTIRKMKEWMRMMSKMCSQEAQFERMSTRITRKAQLGSKITQKWFRIIVMVSRTKRM